MGEDIWVLAEYDEGGLTQNCREIIYEANRLASVKNKKVMGLLIGENPKVNADDLWDYDIDKIYTLEHSILSVYTTDAYVHVLAEALGQYRPLALFMPATTNTNDFAPRLAAKLKVGLTTNCVKFEWGKDDEILMTRFIYRDRSHCTFASHVRGTQLATVRKETFPPAHARKRDRSPLIEEIMVMCDEINIRTKVLGFIEAEASSVDLSEARMIVAGGRGAGSKEGFQIIYALAEELGASVGASRVATDEGWVPFERQIGQTGKVVAPGLYIACGISGAVHHTMGIKDSDIIVSINQDSSAPIFGLSDLGLIGNMHEVLPLLIEKVKGYKRSKNKGKDEKRELIEVQ